MGRGLEPAGVDLQAKGFREYLNKLQQIEKANRQVFDQDFKGTGLSYNQVISAARKYEQQLKNTSKGAADFGAASVTAGNLAAGAINRIIDLVGQAAIAFGRLSAQIVAGGIQLNKQAELSGLVLGNVFNDPKLGEAAIKFVNELSAQFRVNRTEAAAFAETILPRTGGLEEFTKLLELASIQARLTGQPLERLTFSIREALSGDFVSLRDRFDLPREQIRRIQELTPELGAAGALAKVLGDEFTRLGKTNISGALSSNIGDIQARFIDLQAILGEPAFDVLKASSADFLNFLDNNKDVLVFVAEQLGAIAAQAVEFVTSGLTDFLEEIDFEDITELGDAFFRAVNAAELLIDLLSDTDAAASGIGKIASDLETVADVLEGINDLIRPVKAFFEATALDNVISSLSPTGILNPRKQLDTLKAIREEGIFNQEKYNESLEETQKAVDRASDREKDYANALDEVGKKNRGATEDEKKRIDEILKGRSAEDAAARAAENRAKALAEAAKQAEQLQLSFARAAEDAARQQTRQVAKLNRDQFKARQKLLNDQAKEFDDFNKDQAEAIAKAEKDLAKEREKANKERVREQDKLFRELRQAQERYDLDRIQSQRRFTLEDTRLRAEGDILGLQRLREDFALEQQEQAENFDLQQKQRKEDAKDQEQQQNEQRQERLQEAEQELRDLQDSFAEKQAEFLQAQDEEFQELLAGQAEQRLALQKSFAEQEEDRRISQQRQLEDLGRSLAQQEDITAEGAAAIAQQLEEAFGVEGVADQIMSGFTMRQESAFRKLFESISEGAKTTKERLEELSGRAGSGAFGATGFDRPSAFPQRVAEFQEGGVVPGPVGAPRLAVVHGGERVLTPQQQQTFRMPIAAPSQVNVAFGGRSQIDVSGLEGANQATVDRAVEQMIELNQLALQRILRRYGIN